MKTSRTSSKRRALTLSDTLVVIATVALIGVVLLPAVVPHRSCGTAAARISCVNNLKQVGLAFRIYANDNNDLYPQSIPDAEGGAMDSVARGDISRVFQVMSNELSVPKTVMCPADSREYATNFTNFNHANISYFVGLDATDTKPNMILAGDRHLAVNGTLLSGVQSLSTNRHPEWTALMHEGAGNIALADGSVQQVTTANLNQHLAVSGDEMNRIAFPQ